MRLERIQGAGGGGSSGGGGGVESPDSLHSIAYARVLDVISEGEIVGLVNGLQSVTFDGTPILNSDGTVNFQNYSVDTRTGTVDQEYLSGFPSVENETSIGVALTSDDPWVQEVSNLSLSAVRIRFGVPALEQTNTSTGDITGYRIEYAIDLATDGGSYSEVVTGAFDGKTTSLYERSIRVDLPTATTGWLVRVRRVTPNAHNSYISDTVNIEAITEIIDKKLRYPNSALVGMQFDAKTFSNVPTRAYYVRGRIVSIPSNYNADNRTYTGTWDGTFVPGWTNNPAWIFYDLVQNDRFGGGKFIDASSLDKWSLYEIAQYCDEEVDDLKGGTEPRFTCNVAITSQADAFKVLQDIAGIFRGQAYWGAGSVVASADMPMDPSFVYTQANVIDGKFTYAGSERKSRYTAAQISWNDPANQGKAAVEYVQDDDGLARYGLVKAAITAFGCTSQGQARRLANWTLATSRLETQTVTFSVGLDGILCSPGDVIAIADAYKAGRRFGGRIKSMTDTTVVLDKAATVKVGDTLSVIMPTGLAEQRTVDSFDGSTITVTTAFDDVGVPGAVWMIESTDLVSQLFRVTDIAESDDNGQISYEVTAVTHEPGKYDLIDNGAQIQTRPVTVIPPSTQAPPTAVTISSNLVLDQGIQYNTMTIAWDRPANAVTFSVEWRKDNGQWVTAGSALAGTSVDVQGVYSGLYEARVRAINSLGATSIPTTSDPTTLAGKTGAPPVVSFLNASTNQVFAIELDWGFPADGSANDSAYTEICYSKTASIADATTLSNYAYPTNAAHLLGLAAGQSLFFWARLVDRSGNIGAWYPDGAGVNGQSSSSASDILNQIASATADEVAGSLLAPIQQIPGLTDQVGQLQTDLNGLGDIDWDTLQEEIQAIQNADLAGLTTDVGELMGEVFPELAGDDGVWAGDDGVYVGAVSIQSQYEGADLALSQRIDGLAAAVNDASNAAASIVTEAQARADADSALSEQITALQATFQTDNDTLSAQIQQEASARADADQATASQLSDLEAKVNTDIAAQISDEATARADADSALASDITTLQAKTADDLSAAVQSVQSAYTTADTALGERIDTVQATAGDASSAVQTLSQSYADLSGKVNATYSVRVQTTSGGTSYAAGFELQADGSGQSEMVVSAQKFVVIDDGSTNNANSPFAIQGGQTFINSAFIQNGTIVDAMIGGQIKSTSINSQGNPAWLLDKSGNFYIYGTGGGNARMEITNNRIAMFDGNGTLRIDINATG
ncbi:phage tail protein [Paraburkholderia sp. Ac-20340]|uniref:TipJ family phage tail tip protein n=1 Tax=Paraburkholderia sp. Ac-20340 TaxID=2703888 RepID=UPI00197F3D5E|nr:phage tail protein [Paraburkholderia sp. Ac-20340]MBN3852821.1 phage tail protein [Paraburkholderia sp. Ac-20340]